MKKTVTLITVAAIVLAMLIPLASCSMVSGSETVDGLSYILNADGNSYSFLVSSADNALDVVVASTVKGKPVTKIVSDIFKDGSDNTMNSIVIPDSVTEIEASAFDGCYKLTSITISKNLKKIGEGVFEDCPLKETEKGDLLYRGVTYNDGTTNDYYLLVGVKEGAVGTSYTIDPQTRVIANGAFNGNDNLTSISFSEKLLTIEADAFSGCENLTSVHLPEGLTYIGQSAFIGCFALSDVSIPNSIEYISNSAFYGIAALKEMSEDGAQINKSAAYLGNSTNPKLVLYQLSDSEITSFTALPETKIICNISGDCTNLTSISTVGSNVVCIGSVPNPYLTSVTIGANVRIVDSCCFMQCEKLQTVTFESGSKLETIRWKSFAGTAISTITIPASVTRIEGSAFSDCASLTGVTLENPDGWRGPYSLHLIEKADHNLSDPAEVLYYLTSSIGGLLWK